MILGITDTRVRGKGWNATRCVHEGQGRLTMAEWKRGDEILMPVLVKATINAQTNERTPTGNWWVQVDGEIALRAAHESEFRAMKDDRGEQ